MSSDVWIVDRKEQRIKFIDLFFWGCRFLIVSGCLVDINYPLSLVCTPTMCSPKWSHIGCALPSLKPTLLNYRAAKTFILDKLERELPAELYYHSVAHTKDVLNVTRFLCTQEGVTAYATRLLQTAALFHDAGFTRSHIAHEQHGCDIARQYLPQFDYTANDIGQICGMIMATKIPQSPQNKLEEILSDADLDYLGRSDFYPIGARLYRELRHRQPDFTIPQWDAIQISFLERHHFFTATNQKTRAPQKAKYLAALKAKYDIAR